jgi:hypothetical protein
LAIVAWEDGGDYDYRIRRALAGALGAAGWGTCEVDLLKPLESGDPAKRDDLRVVTQWCQQHVEQQPASAPGRWNDREAAFNSCN